MNLRDLRYLIAVAEQRHFGRAAEACHVSQPTLSAQLKKLEDYLGVTLIERTNKRVAITPIGAEILERARQAVEQADAIVQLAQSHRDPMSGPLRLGVIPTLGPYLMPLVLGPLRQRYPDLELVLSEEVTEALLQRLAEHEIDAALLATPIEEAGLDELPLFEEPFWLAYPRGHELETAERITQGDLEQADLLLLSDGHCLRDQVLEVCGRAARGAAGEVGDLRAASLETILQLVAAGYGCTLVPALAMRGPWMTDMGVLARPLDLPSGRRLVRLAHRKSFPRHAALEALAALVVETLPNTVTPLRMA